MKKETINKELEIPITTPEAIDRQIVQQGLHTPDSGITDPTNDAPAYDSRFYAKAPVPDIALQGVANPPLKSFKASQPNKSWYMPNTFEGTYSPKLTMKDIERQTGCKPPKKSNMVDYGRDLSNASGDDLEGYAQKLLFKETGRKEYKDDDERAKYMALAEQEVSSQTPTDDSGQVPPLAPEPEVKKDGMNKILILGGAALLLYVLYTVVKK